MEILCIDTDVNGLSKNKRYKIIKKNSSLDEFFLINDFGVEKWYERCPFGVIKIVVHLRKKKLDELFL